jgi:plastocyanin
MLISRHTPSLTALAVVATLGLAACVSSSTTSSTSTGSTSAPASAAPAGASGYGSASPAPAAGPTAKLSADPSGALKFNVATLRVKAGAVTLQMTDPSGSGVPHGISVQGHGVDKDSSVVQPGGTATVTATLKPGTYQFYCPVPGHEAAGMKGTLIVT